MTIFHKSFVISVLSAMTFLPAAALAQARTTSETAVMPAKDPRSIVLGFFADAAAGQLDAAAARLSEHVVYEILAPAPIGRVVDRKGFLEVSKRGLERAAGPRSITVEGVTAEGERVAVEVRMRTALKNGKYYDNRYHFLMVVRNGEIVEAREYFDSAYAMAAFSGG